MPSARLLPCLLLALSGLACFAPRMEAADGQTPEQALAKMRVAPGFKLELFAAEPLIKQPLSMSFDHKGRMWLVQYLQYPNPAGLTAVKVDRYLRTIYDKVPEPPPQGPKGLDRVTILTDTDGDGRADHAHDFLNDLNLATGVAIGHGGVFVAQAPYLLFYADKNADDKPDGPPEVLLSGFGLEDSHALVNSLQWGPDGWLYGAQGSTVTANIRGLTFQQGIWRYHPLTKEFELFAEGGGNTWGVDFDRRGQLIAGTNFGSRAALHQVQGAYYVKNFGKHGELQNPYAFGFFEHIPYPDFKGGHVTCGGIVYQGGAFPDEYRDQYLAANLLSNVIDWHKFQPDGSSFQQRRGGELFGTEDTWFRPVDCTVGPDGSLYVADWYDKRANHVDPKDDWDKTNGRIYRLTSTTHTPHKFVDVAKLSSGEVAGLLTHANAWYRREARRTLAERRDAGQLPGLLERTLGSKNPDEALECLWAWYVSGGEIAAQAPALLASPHADVRAWTVRLLGDPKRVSPENAARLVQLAKSDTSPTVRNQLACTAKRLPAADGLAIAGALAARDEDANDPFLPLLIWWAIEDKSAAHADQVVQLLARKEAWSQAIVRKSLAERIARRYAAGAADSPEDPQWAACAKLLALAPTPEDTDVVARGIELGLSGRRLKQTPPALTPALDALWAREKKDAALVRFAIRLGSRPAYEYALARVADRKLPVGERLPLIDVLGQVADDDAAAGVGRLLDGAEPAGVQAAAIAALARFKAPEIAETVLAQYPKLSSDLKTKARGLLCSRQSWAKALLAAVDAKQIDPKEMASDQLQQITLHNDKELNKTIEKHWGKIAPQTTGEKAARISGLNTSLRMAKGDVLRGKVLYTKHCGTCHTLFGEGNKIGPELTGADRKNTLFMLSNIVDPSAMIRKEFIAYTLQLADGRVLTGLVAESNPTSVTILDAKNQKTVVATNDIDEMEQAALSIMPEKILDALTVEEVRDLFAYVQSADGK